MITGHIFVGASLDGFIAREDGGIDWLNQIDDAGEDNGYEPFIESMDGLVIGRATYETALSFGEWLYPKPVIVLSRSLSQADVRADLEGKVRIMRGAPREIMESLAAEGRRRVYVDGGQVIQSFLRAGLIADITLTHVPVLLGRGIPLFGELEQDIWLEHLETKTFPSGLVQSRYAIREKK